MSARFAKIPEQFLRDPRITLRDHKVYAALRLYADRDGGNCFPAREKIAEICGLMRKDQDGRAVPHVARVSEITANLERLGWIKKVGKGGRLRGDKGRHTCFTLFDAPESTLPNSGSLAESTTLDSGASTVPDSGTVTKSTVPDSGTSTVPDSGTQNRGFSQSTSGFPATHQTIDQTLKEITDHVGGACAPVAACAAPPPPVFSHDQNQDQNPKTDERQQEQTTSTTEPTAATQPATAAEPTAATQRAKPCQRGKKVKRGTRLTLEELPADWRTWAEGFIENYDTGDLIDVDRTWLKFRDHFKAATGKNATKMDWPATWKNWLRRDFDGINQRPSTRKIIEENRAARARRETQHKQWAAQQAEREREEAADAERKMQRERRRIELAPLAEKVKAYLADIPHGLTGYDLASLLNMTEDDLEAVYRLHLARDPEIVCCSPKLNPSGEWVSAATHAARESAKKAQPKAQHAPAAATVDAWAWYDDAPTPATASAPAPAEPPPAARTPAPAPAPAELENAYDIIEEAGPRGIDFCDIVARATPRVLKALRDAGRVRMDGTTAIAAKFGGRSDGPKPLSEALMSNFSTASSNTTASGWMGITGRQAV